MSFHTTSVLPRIFATSRPVSSRGAPVWGGRLDLGLIAGAGDELGPPDEQPRIDAERPADQPQHHHGADAQSAATHRHTAETAETAAAAFLAAILDIAAFRQVIQ